MDWGWLVKKIKLRVTLWANHILSRGGGLVLLLMKKNLITGTDLEAIDSKEEQVVWYGFVEFLKH